MGLPLRVFLSSLAAVVVSAAILAVSAGYRSDRVRSWLNPSDPQTPAGPDRQSSRWLKVAFSATVWAKAWPSGTTCPTPTTTSFSPSSAKSWVSSARSDCWGYSDCSPTPACASLADCRPVHRLLTATTTLWVLGQAFINIGYVIGLLPVTGLQLPLISAGGTSTAATLSLIGIIANAARHEPEAVAALQAGRDDKVNRLLRLPLPEPYHLYRGV